MFSQWPHLIRSLLKTEPFARFHLVSAMKEWFVERPDWLWIPEEAEFAFYSSEGTTDIINLALIEHVRIEDDFGMVEARRLVEE